MKRTIITIGLVVLLLLMMPAMVLGFSSTSVTQTITQEIVSPGEEPEPEEPEPEPEPVIVRDPNQFDVFVRFGHDYTKYRSRNNNTLRGSIEAAGEYNGAQYMLEIPKGSVVTGADERINWLWLSDIDDGTLSFVGGDALFSEPCILYIAVGGRLHKDRMTGEWEGDGEWIEVGSFTSIIDGKAVLE